MRDDIRPLSKLSDEALMLEYKLGDAEAFQVLYERHMDKIYGYLSNKLNSRSQVDDVFQDVFLRLHRFRAKYDASFPFLPWLFTICRNAMVDHFRCLNRNREQSIGKVDETTDNTTTPRLDLSEGLKTLSVKEGNVLELHYLQGYSFNEVASYLNIKPASARKISSRAISKLKAFLKLDV